MQNAFGIIRPMMADRAVMHERIHAAIRTAQALPECDASRIIVFGYCFGGGVSLECARENYPGVVGVASFHGTLAHASKVEGYPAQGRSRIAPKIIVFHGAEDKRINTQVQDFQDEMRAANADWQFVTFSNTAHSFTEPHAGSDVSSGIAYTESSDRRSWKMFMDFAHEVFGAQ